MYFELNVTEEIFDNKLMMDALGLAMIHNIELPSSVKEITVIYYINLEPDTPHPKRYGSCNFVIIIPENRVKGPTPMTGIELTDFKGRIMRRLTFCSDSN